eukprot:TRINITY_DN57582_c0_g1_i1.p1 TRINITY_DN57582_c0_g1~~TRINITY_DN57582_c0_g1_i1.p1  ORF type:complete len:374 (-),score=70.25 TRINITY_DN57582_c0_g1_i1:54-1175(-)
MATAWDAFAARADDDVLLLALGYLRAAQVLTFTTASASAVARLAGEVGDTSGSQPASGVRPTVAHRFAAAQLGGAASSNERTTVFCAGSAAGTSCGPGLTLCNGCGVCPECADAGGYGGCSRGAASTESDALSRGPSAADSPLPLAALRALAGSAPVAEAFRLASALAAGTWQPSQQPQGTGAASSGGAPSCSEDAVGRVVACRRFLEALHRSELLRRQRSVPEQAAPAAIADAALTSLLRSSHGAASTITSAAAEVVRASECDLDTMVDDERFATNGAYEAIAVMRSAAEFLRQRLDVAAPSTARSASAAASRLEFDRALASLDETIVGYTKEGYVLACRAIVGGFRKSVYHHSHWWIFLDGSQAHGWAAFR